MIATITLLLSPVPSLLLCCPLPLLVVHSRAPDPRRLTRPTPNVSPASGLYHRSPVLAACIILDPLPEIPYHTRIRELVSGTEHPQSSTSGRLLSTTRPFRLKKSAPPGRHGESVSLALDLPRPTSRLAQLQARGRGSRHRRPSPVARHASRRNARETGPSRVVFPKGPSAEP
ncbi:hypothetical protein C8Q77DRAFT_14833 [Trametes polyzona]|nr:hypothetical protein C8Q77DRAFT_14833 [Trametes polyzona]